MKRNYSKPLIKMVRIETGHVMSLSIPIDHTIKVTNPDDVMANEMPLFFGD